MTDQQIENWRKVLCGMIGPYALIMPKEDIIKIRDRMQGVANSFADTNKFFEVNGYSDEFDVTNDSVKVANCGCCNSHRPLFECTDVNNKIFFICHQCLNFIENNPI